MININDEIAIAILDSIKVNEDIYKSKHDISIISFNLIEMEKAGLIKFQKKRNNLENGKISCGLITMTDLGEEFYKNNK